MRERYWAVIMDETNRIYSGTIGHTWDIKHPEDKRKEKTVEVYAIYPKKKDAVADAKFRGSSFVEEVNIGLMKGIWEVFSKTKKERVK